MSLALSEAPATTLYRALCQRLKTDQNLRRVVKTFVFLTDDAKTVTLPASSDELPWIRFTCDTGQTNPITEGLSQSPLVFKVELVIDGTDFADLANLWYAVEKSLFPGDGSMMTLLTTLASDGQRLGNRLLLSNEGCGVKQLGDGATLQTQGLIVVTRMTNTSL